jgi:hypothetical protein
MKLNVLKLSNLAPPHTYEGAPAALISPEAALRRSVLASMLWENEFYESGQTIAARIRELVPRVEPAVVSALAVEARTRMKLRHAPLLLVREMARYPTHRMLVAETLVRIIQRADELAEFIAIYWADGRVPLSAQVKKGLAAAFTNFDEYALAKYNRAGEVKLRDVLFLCHARPRDAAQAELWKRLAAGELRTPDTWEVALSSGGDKRAHWERMLVEGRLGALALLRNLRNMKAAGVSEDYIAAALDTMRIDRVLPFRFLAAARHAPEWEPMLERAMFRSLGHSGSNGFGTRLAGHTVLLVDVSGSMVAPLSNRSTMLRTDAAYGLAILLTEVAEKVSIYTFSDAAVRIPPRRGFALRDAMELSQQHRGTRLGAALDTVSEPYDRIVVITDEQSRDRVGPPRGTGYMINVASARNGVGYGPWTHIDGFSEAAVEYIREMEHARMN